MKVIIIDDENKARTLLRTIITKYCPVVQKCLDAPNLLQGVELIKNEKPQVVFLDIEMPEYSGLDILDFFETETIDFHIIFTTAYSEYALKAFELSAIDYLLKPMRPKQVVAALEKVLKNSSRTSVNGRLDELKKSLEHGTFNKVALPVNDGIKFVNFEDIIMFEADSMYSKISTLHDKNLLISKPLKHFVDLLNDVPYFYRSHRSFLINLKFIKQYVKSDGGYLLMDNDNMVSISKDKRSEFLLLMGSL